MKAALLLCCIAVLVALHAADYVCNPNKNNMPDCTNTTNHGVKIRNFFDSTRYWWCNSSNEAVAVPCEIIYPNGTVLPRGFSATKGDCVPWGEYKWTPCCP